MNHGDGVVDGARRGPADAVTVAVGGREPNLPHLVLGGIVGRDRTRLAHEHTVPEPLGPVRDGVRLEVHAVDVNHDAQGIRRLRWVRANANDRGGGQRVHAKDRDRRRHQPEGVCRRECDRVIAYGERSGSGQCETGRVG